MSWLILAHILSHPKGSILKQPILVTGAAGFIGMHVGQRAQRGGP
jgi:hypothetical protein